MNEYAIEVLETEIKLNKDYGCPGFEEHNAELQSAIKTLQEDKIVEVLEEKLCDMPDDRKRNQIMDYMRGGFYEITAKEFIKDIAKAIINIKE